MTRRFIAGAVCPRCGELDKIVMLMDSKDKHRECVSCGYTDALDNSVAVDEPATRVNQPRADEKPLSHEDAVQILKLDSLTHPPKKGGAA